MNRRDLLKRFAGTLGVAVLPLPIEKALARMDDGPIDKANAHVFIRDFRDKVLAVGVTEIELHRDQINKNDVRIDVKWLDCAITRTGTVDTVTIYLPFFGFADFPIQVPIDRKPTITNGGTISISQFDITLKNDE